MTKTVKILIQGYQEGDASFASRDEITNALKESPQENESILHIKPTSLEHLQQLLNAAQETYGTQDVNYELFLSGHGQSIKAYDAFVAEHPESANPDMRMDGIMVGQSPSSFQDVFSAIPKAMAGSMYLDACYSGESLQHVDHLPLGFALYPSGSNNETVNISDTLLAETDLAGLVASGRTSPSDFFIERRDVVAVDDGSYTTDLQRESAVISLYAVSGVGKLGESALMETSHTRETIAEAKTYLEDDKSNENGAIAKRHIPLDEYASALPSGKPLLYKIIGKESESSEIDAKSEAAALAVLGFISDRDEKPFTHSLLQNPTAIRELYDPEFLNEATPETKQTLAAAITRYTGQAVDTNNWNEETAKQYVQALKANDLPIQTTPQELIAKHQYETALESARAVGDTLLKGLSGITMDSPEEVGSPQACKSEDKSCEAIGR